MRPINSYLTSVLLLLFIFAVPNSALAFPHYKVALLPTINTADLKATDLADLIQHKIHRKLRFPFYEFLSDIEIANAQTILPLKNGSILPTQPNLMLISQQLAADIVLVPEVVRGGVHVQHHFSFWNDETIETTDVLIKCYVYSTKDNQYYVAKAGKYNSAPLQANSGVLNATDPIIDELLKKLPFETIPPAVLTQ